VSRAKELTNTAGSRRRSGQEEIKRMLATGLQVRARCARQQGFRFLTKTYLPKKLKDRDWLD